MAPRIWVRRRRCCRCRRPEERRTVHARSAPNLTGVSLSPDPVVPSRPSGTVTFAFTDIEGSTQRWERDRAAMESAVRRHDWATKSEATLREGAIARVKTVLGADAYEAYAAEGATWDESTACAAALKLQHASSARRIGEVC